jgi:hypothetical protein
MLECATVVSDKRLVKEDERACSTHQSKIPATY